MSLVYIQDVFRIVFFLYEKLFYMKKTILVLCALVVSATLCIKLYAQKITDSKVPVVVRQALIKKYPAAVKATWEKENGNYEANWGGTSGEDMSVQFTPEGNFIEQVKAIPIHELPVAALDYVKAHYKGVKITEAGKVTDAKGVTWYEAEVKGRDVLFDDNGKFVKSE
jgi:hypothetical protein